jgi:hypothetical protein
MVGEHCLQTNPAVRRRHGHGGTVLCPLCGEFQAETVQHMLFECQALQQCRDRLWRDVEVVTPRALLREMNCRQARDRAIFIFSGFGCGYLPQWKDTYAAILNFVATMYIRHSELVI